MTRQYEWAMRQRQQGKCGQCRKLLSPKRGGGYPSNCSECALKQSKRALALYYKKKQEKAESLING